MVTGIRGFMDANRWTNERHLNFLKFIEASFVRRMLENGNDNGRLLLMDRHVPDSCESTSDSATVIGRKKRERHFPADNLDASLGIDRRVKRLRLHSSHFPHEDQVVPQMKHVKKDDDDKN
ncbi:hypothetical protein L1987_43068 [Smallanthus sonchifolius]|uniref:Uncharacterized protein n=1 Tax=Smallanthus sonchifolius TaxID=185202 RepID=A0ACB9GKP5_9ASTR|nr:hypothetical protein L1987_43068 [Smallanthus sonchifolius]